MLVKVGPPTEKTVEAIYAGLQDGVHFMAVNVSSGFIERLREMQAHAADLERVVMNANGYARWALSPLGLKCYLFEMLLGVARKLAYRPRVDGFFVDVMNEMANATGRFGRVRLRGHAAHLDGGTAVQGTTYHLGKLAYVHESAPIRPRPRGGSRLSVRGMQQICQQFKKLKPLPLSDVRHAASVHEPL